MNDTIIEPVTFVVLTKNNASTIRDCLSSIVKQNYPDFDVLVIDDCSCDSTIDIVMEFMTKYSNVTMYECGHLTIGAARQFGVEKVTNKFIAFVDSDCELPYPAWLTKMMSPFIHDTVAVSWVMGTYKKSYPSIARYTIMSDAHSVGGIPLTVTKENYMPIGMGHTVVRKSAIDEVGGFKDMAAAEDIDMTKKLVNAGYSLMYVVSANVYHLHATSYQNYMRKYKRNISVTVADLGKEGTKPNYVKFAVDNTIMPFVTCALGLVSDRDTAWLWHPIICYSKCVIAVRAFL